MKMGTIFLKTIVELAGLWLMLAIIFAVGIFFFDKWFLHSLLGSGTKTSSSPIVDTLNAHRPDPISENYASHCTVICVIGCVFFSGLFACRFLFPV